VTRDIDQSSEDVHSEWSRKVDDASRPEPDEQPPFDLEQEPSYAGPQQSLRPDPEPADEPSSEAGAWGSSAPETAADETDERDQPDQPDKPDKPDEPDEAVAEAEPELVEEPEAEPEPGPMVLAPSHEHAVGELRIPDGYAVLEGEAGGTRRSVGVVVSRFNGAVTTRLLERALAALDEAGVSREAITIMVVPGAFELPLAATALAKTRRFACVVALGCVIRGETPHFDYVAGEAASGLQLAALETGVPVSFGVLTLDAVEQADARIEKGAEAVHTALEMADVFSHLRAAASR
jgi:6,7-dimethyl-8-ribityllumazine synthase